MEGVALYALLLIAISIGWLLGRSGSRSIIFRPRQTRDIFHEYFAGLNYLLNDEPDEAIDTFIKALEVSGETVETHLALGALLRRRGKVDKAIKVHQALLARSGLEASLADAARLQLAKDYISGGLLDRAERLLKELAQGKSEGKWEALPLLVSIYQLEKEWHRAITCTKELLSHSAYRRSAEWNARMVHYHCEIAEGLLVEGQLGEARQQLRRGGRFQRHHLRASLLTARLEHESGNCNGAIRECRRIAEHSPEFLPELVDVMAASYSELGRAGELIQVLDGFLDKEANPVALQLISRLIAEAEGADRAIQYIRRHLAAQPSLAGVAQLLELEVETNQFDPAMLSDIEKIREVLLAHLAKQPGFRCGYCGYEARQLYWLCPGCHRWDSIQPKLEKGR